MLITLEAARRNIGYSQKEAADLFGIHYQTLAKLEEDSSNAPFAFIQKIPKIYKIPTNNIFFGSKKRVYSFIKKQEGSCMKEASGMYALMQYIRDYIRSHPDEYQEWVKKNGEEKHE